MPKKKDEINKTEVLQLRLTTETRERCKIARISGGHKLEAESSFLGFLIEIGLAKYEKAFLPLELGEDEIISPSKKSKIS